MHWRSSRLGLDLETTGFQWKPPVSKDFQGFPSPLGWGDNGFQLETAGFQVEAAAFKTEEYPRHALHPPKGYLWRAFVLP